MGAEEKGYWIGRWQRGETGWHQTEVDPVLIANFSDLPRTRVLVPLCGKSLDLGWLADRGHEVIGVEASALACEAFFKERGVPFERTRKGRFDLYRGGGVSIYCGDFFDLTPEELGEIGAVYDRAALIALPPPVRQKYATRMTELIQTTPKNPGFRFLQLLLERTPPDEEGPPFSVSAQELEKLYGKNFEIALLETEPQPRGMQSAFLLLRRR